VQYLNDPKPWTEGIKGDLSMVDLVSNETIPAMPAAMLWWALERGASILTAGGPSGAGKTTLANACLSFLPEGARAYAVAGSDDPLDDPRLAPADGGSTYLLVCELSDHARPYYIAGEPARRVFALVRDGVRVVGTLHADSVDEAVEVLGGEVELSPEDIARVDLLVVTRVDGEVVRGANGRISRVPPDAKVRRRIVEIALRGPDPEGRVGRITLAAWNAASDRLDVADAPNGVEALARWAGVSAPTAAAEIARRADALGRLASEGRREARDVDEAVRQLRTT
jgi:hypothetical protein